MNEHQRLSRRLFLKEASMTAGILGLASGLADSDARGAPGEKVAPKMDETRAREWLSRWKQTSSMRRARGFATEKWARRSAGWSVPS